MGSEMCIRDSHWRIKSVDHVGLLHKSNTVGLELVGWETDLDWLEQFENLEELVLSLRVGKIPLGIDLDWQTIDELPNLKRCCVGFDFSTSMSSLRRVVQSKYLTPAMWLRQLEELSL